MILEGLPPRLYPHGPILHLGPNAPKGDVATLHPFVVIHWRVVCAILNQQKGG